MTKEQLKEALIVELSEQITPSKLLWVACVIDRIFDKYLLEIHTESHYSEAVLEEMQMAEVVEKETTNYAVRSAVEVIMKNKYYSKVLIKPNPFCLGYRYTFLVGKGDGP